MRRVAGFRDGAAASPDERLREALAGLLAADEAAAAGNPDLLFPAFDAARAALAAADREAPDDWRCECGDLNRGAEAFCFRCGACPHDDEPKETT